MYLSREEEKDRFKKNLFEFLGNRGVGNLKVPQIGGKELDLYELYQAVIRRGGAQKVSNNKMWKEIVNEFDLPPSCTSASFTLKNHYQKYLLTYEQKFYFGRSEDEMVKELGSVRQKRPRYEDEPPTFTRREPTVQKDVTTVQAPVTNESNLRHNLQHHYEKKIKEKEDIIYAKKSRLIPYASEVRRIMLAFESHIQDEVRFALNSLLLYSCSYSAPFCIENYTMVFESLIGYLDEIIRNVPIGFKRNENGDIMVTQAIENGTEKPVLTVFDNYNFEISDIMNTSSLYPLGILKNDIKQCVALKYEEITTKELLEQIRIISQILRNLIFIKSNDQIIFKNEKCFNLIVNFFFNCIDPEITRNV